jgi:hypothetical protein
MCLWAFGNTARSQDLEDRVWERQDDSVVTERAPPSGYSQCDFAVALTNSMEVLACRRVEQPGALETPPLQLLLVRLGASRECRSVESFGPMFGDAYIVRLAVFYPGSGSTTPLLVAESHTEYPLGMEVFEVSESRVRSFGVIDVSGIDERGEAIPALPMIKVRGREERIEIVVEGRAVRSDIDGSTTESASDEWFCFILDNSKLISGRQGSDHQCRPE